MSADVEDPISPRKTLKLKAAPAPRAPPVKSEPKPNTGSKAAATHDWAAEHKRRMQADMDALSGKRKL